MSSAFHSIAAFYEALSDSEERLRREGALLKECLAAAPGPRVADLACGTGLHARFLVDLGAEVTALDISPEMVAHAGARRPHAGITYLVGDMRAIEGGPWDLAICLGNSLSLLDSLDQLDTVMSAVYAALSPGGIFLLQIINYASAAVQQPRHRVERKTVGEAEIVAVKNLVPHEDRTLLALAFYSVRNGQYASASETAVLMNLSREQVLDSAERAKFRVGAVYGGFDRSEYDPDASTDLVCILEKPSYSP